MTNDSAAALGKGLVVFGLLLVLAGITVFCLSKTGFLGRLPGDIYLKKGNFSFYFPITTCLLLSLFLTFLFRFFGKK